MFRGDGRRKYLRPDQQVRIWAHVIQESTLQIFGKGIRSRIQDLPNLNVEHKDVMSWINDNQARESYNELSKNINKSVLPDAVSRADGYILFAITRALNIKKALEVGTRLGFSTLHIAAGLEPNSESLLTTIDLHDMNGQKTKLYEEFGSDISPRELLSKFSLENNVEFIVGDSAQYLRNCDKAFDLVFIDGDHSEVGAYFDILYAIQKLNNDGIIILHDYNNPYEPTPGIKKGLHGVYWALERLKQHLPSLKVIPIQSIQYENSDHHPTSLAIVSKH